MIARKPTDDCERLHLLPYSPLAQQPPVNKGCKQDNLGQGDSRQFSTTKPPTR